MNAFLKSATALLGLWLVVETSVFSGAAALWIAFATAIAIGSLALADTLATAARRRVSSSVATAGLAGFLVIASLVFEGASLGWIMPIAGASIVAYALSSVALPRLRVSAAATADSYSEPAAPRLAA